MQHECFISNASTVASLTHRDLAGQPGSTRKEAPLGGGIVWSPFAVPAESLSGTDPELCEECEKLIGLAVGVYSANRAGSRCRLCSQRVVYLTERAPDVFLSGRNESQLPCFHIVAWILFYLTGI